MSTTPPVVNTEQADAWNGDDGHHWATHHDRYDAMSGAFTPPLLAAAAIGERDDVLDIGCGNGQTTHRAARAAGHGTAVGIDLSEPMLARARATAATEKITNATFLYGDAQVHPFPSAGFDVAISRFGIMFFADPTAAFANIARALRPGGRLAFVCWQEMARNEWLSITAGAVLEHVPMPDLGDPDGPGAFSFADPDRTTGVLRSAGFEEVHVDDVEAPMTLGRDADDAVAFLSGTGLARAMLDPAPPEDARKALDAVADVLRPHERPDGVRLAGAAWLVTARRP